MVLASVYLFGDISMATTQARQDRIDQVESFTLSIWNDRDYDSIGDYVSDDITQHGPTRGMTIEGPDGVIENIRQYQEAFSDLTASVEMSFTDEAGEYVCMYIEYTGTHDGELMGIEPTERTVTTNAIAIHRFEGDKVAESWVLADFFGMFEQLGARPTDGPLA